MPDRILINEVSPRDGLQNQATHLSIGEKLELIESLVEAGLKAIEATSFVSPKAVPQLADADELFPRLPNPDGIRYSALVPNVRGLERALNAGVREIALVLSATDTMNRRNINMSLDAATQACIETMAAADLRGVRKKVYIAVAFTCPFEGQVAPGRVIELADAMFAKGADEVVIADTIGAANPREVSSLLAHCVERFGAARLAAHFHDTRGFALANAWAALTAGIRNFDASAGGLGGCPFAPGASGNLATEDLVLMAEQCGFETGVDVPRLRKAVATAGRLTHMALGGRTTAWLQAQDLKDRHRRESAGSACQEN